MLKKAIDRAGTWQGFAMTPGVWDWLAERGYSTHRMPMSKREDAESILGPELVRELEAAELRMLGFEVRADGQVNPAMLILKDEHEPGVNPVSLLLESDNYQVALNLVQPLFENALENIIASQMSPQQVIVEAGQIASAAAPLKENAATVVIEAAKLAQARLLATSRAVNPQELERASAMLIEFLTRTHFPGMVERAIRADEDSGDIMSATQARMMGLIEPSISEVAEDAAPHLATLVESVVSAIVDGNQTVPLEEKMNIPSAEFNNTQSAHDVTPRLRAMLRANEGLTSPAPAPQLVARQVPAAAGGPSIAQINQAVSLALAPLVADLNALKARNASITRMAPRRAMAPPQVSRQAAAAAVGGGSPAVIRTVESSAFGGLPTRRRVFSAAQVSRRSVGLGLTERSSAPRRPAAYPSRYQPSSTFATAQARDHFDAGFANKPNGVAIHGDLIRRNLAQFPTL